MPHVVVFQNELKKKPKGNWLTHVCLEIHHWDGGDGSGGL